MKKLLFLTFITILVFGCKPDNKRIDSKALTNLSAEKALTPSTIICGKIENIDFSEPQSIYLAYSVYGMKNIEYSKIEQDGTFKFSINLQHPIDYKLTYNRKLRRLYSEPGDSIFIVIDANIYPDKLIVKGDNQDFNNSYLQFQGERRTYFKEYLIKVDSVSDISSTALKNYVISRKYDNDKLVQKFSDKYKWSKEFSNWAITDINYEITHDLTFYRGEKAESYYDYYEIFEINNPSAISSYRYWEYLQGYLVYLMNIKTIIAPDSITLSFMGNQIINNSNGNGKDFLLALSYIWGTRDALFSYNDIKDESSNYFDLITDAAIRDYLYSYSEKYIQTLLSVESGSVKSLNIQSDLGQIFNDHLGSNIYGKVWADWCGSCINSMPDFLKLKQEYPNVEFILFSIDSDKNRIDELLSRFGIEDKCYFLDEAQSSELKQLFEIEAIPHYFIIDSLGNIVNRNSPSPRNFAAKEMLNELNQ